MQLCYDHDIIVKTTCGYASSINGKVERTDKTIKTCSASNFSPIGTATKSDVYVTNTPSGSFSA